MSKSTQAAALIATLLWSAHSAAADVTPQDVWQNWQDAAAAQGSKITAESTATKGDVFVVKGISIVSDDKGGQSTVKIDRIRFKDRGDGTVAIVLPDSFPVEMHIAPAADKPDAKPLDLTLNVTMPGARIIASGVPLSVNYASEMPSLEVAADVTGKGDNAPHVVTDAKFGGVAINYLVEAAESGKNMTDDFVAKTFDLTVKASNTGPGSDADVTLSLADFNAKAALTGMPASGSADFQTALKGGLTVDLSLTYGIGSIDVAGHDAGKPMKVAGTIGGGGAAMALDAAKFHYEANNKALSLNIAGTDQTSGADFTLASTLADFTSQFDMLGTDWTTPQDFAKVLKTGLKMSGAFGIGASSFDFSGGPSGKPTKVKVSFGGAGSDFAIAADEMHYKASAKAVSLSATSPDIPVPNLSADLGALDFKIAMPVTKSNQPSTFAYLTRIADLKLPEQVWALFDPTAALPHDPATLVIDTKGTATMTKDLIDDATALESGSKPQFQLLSLDVTQILARVAGAEVHASGAFTFDNTDTTTIPDMPYPTGKIDIKATGVNHLMDKLVALGLLPKDQATQGHMMLAMLANTNADKDEMTSALEFKDKHFFANGQQLQ